MRVLKKKKNGSTTNFVPGQTIHFLVEVFAFLSLSQLPKTFSHVFHFHNLFKRHSEKQFSQTSFSETKNTRLVYVSGTGPKTTEGEYIKGRLGETLGVDEGYEAARITAINILASL